MPPATELKFFTPAVTSALAPAVSWLVDEVGIQGPAAVQLVSYLSAARAALGALPTRDTIIFERFFDETGGMQLVIHSPFGSRINRAWGLALRKRFCRNFNFELQAAATEDTIILSLTTVHSFELMDVARYLHSNTVRPLLVQALCAAPMFPARWRWAATIALALPRFRGGKKVPPQLARMAAEDLLTAVFPDQVACAENLPGELEIPDHPLVRQTIRDCLEEAMDIEGFEGMLRGLESGAIQVIARDLTEPSPLALEVLSARPYAYLDDAPLEERRTQAVMARRWLDPESAADIGKLDPDAIQRVRDEAWPDATSADELHDALSWLTFLTDAEVQRQPGWPDLLDTLAKQRRVTRHVNAANPGTAATTPTANADTSIGGATLRAAATTSANAAATALGTPAATPAASATLTAAAAAPATSGNAAAHTHTLWVTAERLPLFRALFPNASLHPHVEVPATYDKQWARDEALVEIVRGRLQGVGPTTSSAIAASLALPVTSIETALAALQSEGFAMRGQFTPGAIADGEWCERRLLARIHRYTVKRLRAEIEPVEARDFLRFLFEWQRVTPEGRMEGPDAVGAILSQLEGFEAPASAWETEILPTRISEYEPAWLDEQCLAGRFIWTRLARLKSDSERSAAPVRGTPIVLLARRNTRVWSSLSGIVDPTNLSSRAQVVADYIRMHGASFFDEIADGVGLLPTQVEEALAELVALGIVNSDSFGGLRALLIPSDRRRPIAGGRRKRRIALFGMDAAGRWALVRKPTPTEPGRRSNSDSPNGETPGRRSHRARRPHTVEALGSCILAPAGPRSRLAAAVARPAHVLSTPGSTRRNPRRPLRGRLHGRAIRGAGSHRPTARHAPQATHASARVTVRCRPTQPGRHPDTRLPGAFAQRQPRPLSRRHPPRRVRRQRSEIPRKARAQGTMGGPKPPPPPPRTRRAGRPGVRGHHLYHSRAAYPPPHRPSYDFLCASSHFFTAAMVWCRPHAMITSGEVGEGVK